MKNLVLIPFILTLAILISCNQSSDVVAPLFPTTSTYKVMGNIRYTLSVTKDVLGILDTLDITVTGLNKGNVPDTIGAGNFFLWSLIDANGNVVFSGPLITDNVFFQVVLNPNSPVVLYRSKFSMADIFNSTIKPGIYSLKGTLANDMPMQLNLICGKSTNEISDQTGLSCPVFSLKVGNKWTYKETFYYKYGISPTFDTVYQSVVGEAMINGEKWFLITSSFYVDQYFTIRKDGVYQYYPDLKTAVLKYKYPAAVGDAYTSGYEEWNGASLTLVNYQITVDSVNEVISVPDGKFTGCKYHSPEVDVNFGNV
ncbi:MAG: hypothetical protein P4L45_15125, partial [Ignavibacteriaceae bacterium]|nr:hypothetical protein [Ignavibacteriaceae bacterium]